jgi:hypothetical protein
MNMKTKINFLAAGMFLAAFGSAFGQSTFTKITTGAIVNDVEAFFRCAWGDYDNDGFLDLLVMSIEAQNFLYHNNRDGTFTRVTVGAIANDIMRWGGCAWADYDNDGNLDVLLATAEEDAAQAVLYRNNGDGTFTRLPAETIGGLVPAGEGNSDGPAWADYDNDGFLDLFMARLGIDWLYHNDRNGGFTSITNNLVGTATEEKKWDAAWADYNNDGRPDLFVASDAPTNRLYLNLGGGSFGQVTSGSIVTDSAHSAGCAWADYDNDGNLDLFVVNGLGVENENNSLYHNNRGLTFTRMTSDVVGSIASDPAIFAGCAWGDYDNDGFIDLFVTHGDDLNYLYRNNGDGSFTRILTGSLVNDVGHSVGCAWGDYDNDGFLDLFVAKGGTVGGPQNNGLYRNNGNKNNWLKVKCVGTVSNRSAIGAKVRAKATIGGKTIWQLREISAGSAINPTPLEAHFGLGAATNVETLRIEWPSGIVQEFPNVATKQFLTITEPPRLLSSVTDSVPQFSLKGGRGFQYQIEASTDLVAWSPLGTLTITNLSGIAQITDTNALGSNRRFYRAVSR